MDKVSGPTCRSVGLFIGRVHLTGTSRTLVGGDPWVPMSLRNNGGAAADDTARRNMRWVTGGGSTMSRWLSNKGFQPLCEKAARAIHYSTWRIWGELLPPLAQVRGDQPCASNDGDYSVDKGCLGICLFCSEDCKLHCKMVKLERSIGIGN
jgi:hypothetical protein